MLSPNRLVLLLACVVCCTSNAAMIRRVIGPGDPVPGVPGATFVGASGSPSFDPQGNVRISALIEGPGITWRNNYGFWMESDRQLQMILRQGDALPGATADERIGHWYVHGNNKDWVMLEIMGSQVDARNNQALVSMQNGVVRTVARTGQPAPRMPTGTVFNQFQHPSDDLKHGHMAFNVNLIGPGINVDNDESVWLDDGTGLRLVAREGEIADGATTPFRRFGFSKSGARGQTVFQASIDSPDPLIEYQGGVYTARDGRVVEVLREGVQAPGLPNGVMIRSSYPYLKDNGNILVSAYLGGTNVSSDNDTAIYIDRGNGPELVFRHGDPIPGAPDARQRWTSAGGSRSDALATVLLEEDEWWELTETGWRHFAWPKRGDPAPGTSQTFEYISRHEMNSLGRRLFVATLVHENGYGNGGEGIWAEDDSGQFQLVLRYNEPGENPPGPNPFADDWELVDFNDRGEILLRPYRSGYSEVYVATLDAVPEPATILMAIMVSAVLAFLAWRRQRVRLLRGR
jgi:hypothetical protein